jgi:hypothetical protein
MNQGEGLFVDKTGLFVHPLFIMAHGFVMKREKSIHWHILHFAKIEFVAFFVFMVNICSCDIVQVAGKRTTQPLATDLADKRVYVPPGIFE